MKVILQREIKNMFNDICEYIAELSNLHICLYPYSPQTSEKIIYDVKKEYGLNITTVFAHCDEQYSNVTIVSSNVKPFSELLDITNKSEYLIILGDKINWQLDFWCLEWNGFPCDKLLNFEQLSFYKTVIDNVATTCEEDYQEIFNNIDKCKEVYDLLDDEKSKKIYLRMLAKKITSCPFYFDVFTENQYYDEKLVGKLSDEIFFDVGAYEDKVMGRIPESVCIQLLNKYEAERTEKLEHKKDISAKLATSRANEQSVDDWLDMIQDYTQLEELDRPTLVRLIQKIEVGEKYQVNDHIERDINIYYNFVGFVEL